MSAADIHDVTKVFPGADGGDVVALEHVSFAVEEGEFLCILGPSGCGKSTLLSLLADLETPTDGDIQVYGQTPAEARRRRAIGLVFQDAVLLPWRTVEENIALPLQVLGMDKQERLQKARALAEFVGLGKFLATFPHQLSGGMQQRVGIARALSHDPPLLLMDEPFGALDAITRDRMNVELLDVWTKSEKTIVFITHSIEEAVFLADRILVMSPHPGRIVSVVDNPLPRPRSLALRDEPGFAELARDLRRDLEAP